MGIGRSLSILLLPNPCPASCPRCGGTAFRAEKTGGLFKGKASVYLPSVYHVCDRCGYSPNVDRWWQGPGGTRFFGAFNLAALLALLVAAALYLPGLAYGDGAPPSARLAMLLVLFGAAALLLYGIEAGGSRAPGSPKEGGGRPGHAHEGDGDDARPPGRSPP